MRRVSLEAIRNLSRGMQGELSETGLLDSSKMVERRRESPSRKLCLLFPDRGRILIPRRSYSSAPLKGKMARVIDLQIMFARANEGMRKEQET